LLKGVGKIGNWMLGTVCGRKNGQIMRKGRKSFASKGKAIQSLRRSLRRGEALKRSLIGKAE